MKKQISLFLLLVILHVVSCRQQSAQNQTTAAAFENDIEVYYFHMTTRCVTCRAIESEARKNVEMLYPEQVSSGKITFTALNIEEDAGKLLGDQLGVTGQALLIVRGETKINLTNEGFLYAVGRPDKFATVMKEKIDTLLLK